MKPRKIYEWATRYITVPLVGMACFFIYVCFFNEDKSVMDRMKYEEQIKELNAEIAANLDSLNYYRELNNSLESNAEDIERIVREHYHMQRPNEDIYIFE